VVSFMYMHCLRLLDRHGTDLVSLHWWPSVTCSHTPNLSEIPWGTCSVPAWDGDSCPVGPALPRQVYALVVLGSFDICGSSAGLYLAIKLSSCPGRGYTM